MSRISPRPIYDHVIHLGITGLSIPCSRQKRARSRTTIPDHLNAGDVLVGFSMSATRFLKFARVSLGAPVTGELYNK